MSQQVQNLFDRIAPKYDLLNSLLSFRIDRRWRKEAVNELKSDSIQKVLDVCAGTLALTSALLEVNPRCHVTAVDFSSAMLEEGKKRLPFGYRTRVDLLQADVMELTLPSYSFDAVMCAYGMRNLDNNELALKKIRELLKPNGKLVILDFFKPEGWMSQIFNLTYAEMIIPLAGRLVAKDRQAYNHLRDSVRRFYTPTAYRHLLSETGFTNITVTSQTGGISHLITAEVLS